ncbi:hypothetical protein BDV93DRAFT_524261 [Ceratobasidium sp. AG-I]|nr:hypothetical protein BDV93DRAFT_524261 [Ceratobasidium sp. AG-I]
MSAIPRSCGGLDDTVSTSELAEDRYRFNSWAAAVNLNIHDNIHLPQELLGLRDIMLMFPTWLRTDEDNVRTLNAYSYPESDALMNELRAEISDSSNLRFEDNDTNSNLHLAMPVILETCGHLRMLCADHLRFHYTEADFRWPINHLMQFVWKSSNKDLMKVFLERVLALPSTVGADFPSLCSTTIADSVTCISLGLEPLAAISYDTRSIYSCFPTATSVLLLPHCIIDVKTPEIDEVVSDRQVLFGMVSALYQRRALGFPQQFVFGISHGSGSFVYVYAARWENVGVGRLTERSPQPSGPSVHPIGALQGPADIDTQELDASEEIRKYFLGGFDLRRAYYAVRFYLLMRATMSLAKDYKDAISQTKLRNTSHGWAAPIPTPAPEWPNDEAPASRSASNNIEMASYASGSAPSGSVLPVEYDSRDAFSSDDNSAAGLGSGDEIPAGLGSGSGLNHGDLEKFVETDPVRKCEDWVCSHQDMESPSAL